MLLIFGVARKAKHRNLLRDSSAVLNGVKGLFWANKLEE